MKTLRVLGNEKIEVLDIPEPEPLDDLVVVKILSSGICGTEHSTYFGKKNWITIVVMKQLESCGRLITLS